MPTTEPPTKFFYKKLVERLTAKFPPPYPTNISVKHHKCGGTIMEATVEFFCRKCNQYWTGKEMDSNPQDFTGCDETEYKLTTQSDPVDEFGNKQTRAFTYLKPK